MTLQILLVLITFTLLSKVLANVTTQGEVSAEIIHKESINVKNIIINNKNDTQSPTQSFVTIQGKPGSFIAIEWSPVVVAKDSLTGKEIIVFMKNAGYKNAVIDKSSQLIMEVSPQKIPQQKSGHFKGTYNLNLTY